MDRSMPCEPPFSVYRTELSFVKEMDDPGGLRGKNVEREFFDTEI